MPESDGLDYEGEMPPCKSLDDLKEIARRIFEDGWRPVKYFDRIDDEDRGYLGWIICNIVGESHPYAVRSIIEDITPGSPGGSNSETTVTGFYHMVPSLRAFYLKHGIDPDKGFCMWDASGKEAVPLVAVVGVKYYVLHAPSDTEREGGEVVLIPVNLLQF